MSSLHRIVWIDSQIREKRHPNCRTIAEKFEISARQAARDMEYLRYSMGAPVEYSQQKNGYYYTDHSFMLPGCFISDEEKQALNYLAYQYKKAGSEQAVKLAEFFSRLTGDHEAAPAGKPSLPVLHMEPGEAAVFNALKAAIEERLKVEIQYVNARNESSSRVFCPYRLFSTQRVNYVVGYCESRNAIRIFRLNRICGLRGLGEKFIVSPSFRAEDYGDTQAFDCKEPYTARIHIRGGPTSGMLEFGPKLTGDNVYEITFFQSEKLLAALISHTDDFTILSPNWLRERLKAKLEKILRNH